jgi:hypothetical protein
MSSPSRKRKSRSKQTKQEKEAQDATRATAKQATCTELLNKITDSKEWTKRGLSVEKLSKGGDSVVHRLLFAHLLLHDPLDKVHVVCIVGRCFVYNLCCALL